MVFTDYSWRVSDGGAGWVIVRQVMEGMETLDEINGQFCDNHGRPYRDIRILHTYVLDDPFDDPPQVRE